jgi:hypothetical protein
MGPERLPPGDNTCAKPSERVTRVSARSTEDSHSQGRFLTWIPVEKGVRYCCEGAERDKPGAWG